MERHLTISEFIEVSQNIQHEVRFHKERSKWYHELFTRQCENDPLNTIYTPYQEFLQYQYEWHFVQMVGCEQRLTVLVDACCNEFSN